ncbi:uncharacterized protein [Antedon mediterranea]|uniref:uncharacterized protein n=1 Tax=Antedon mediterranea TaxID=105859 RepID=UPI003AF895E4
MSCIDVVYQSLQRHPYFQYPCRKESEIRAQDLSVGGGGDVKVEEEDSSDSGGSDKEMIPEAEYVSAKCVIFTYFTGDTSKVVDDHFTKALNRPSSFTSDVIMTANKSVNDNNGDINNNNSGPLMSQRVFPPSFWSSNYHNIKRNNMNMGITSTIQQTAFGDVTGDLSFNRADACLQQYSMTQSAYNHRPITELSYGVAQSNCGVFNPRYSSLLIQPPVRASRLPGLENHGDYTKPSDPGWSIAYTNPHEYSYEVANATATSMTDNQDSSKDPFWF